MESSANQAFQVCFIIFMITIHMRGYFHFFPIIFPKSNLLITHTALRSKEKNCVGIFHSKYGQCNAGYPIPRYIYNHIQDGLFITEIANESYTSPRYKTWPFSTWRWQRGAAAAKSVYQHCNNSNGILVFYEEHLLIVCWVQIFTLACL